MRHTWRYFTGITFESCGKKRNTSVRMTTAARFTRNFNKRKFPSWELLIINKYVWLTATATTRLYIHRRSCTIRSSNFTYFMETKGTQDSTTELQARQTQFKTFTRFLFFQIRFNNIIPYRPKSIMCWNPSNRLLVEALLKDHNT
jgi:hypothetical protein